MRTAASLLLAVSCLLLVVPASAQSLCRFYVADQYDYSGNVGFYVDLEGGELAALPIILAVADGTAWRFPRHTPGFEFDRDYQVRAVIAPTGAQLFLDGALVIDSPGEWRPAARPLQIAYRPSWADEPGDWVAVVRDLTAVLTRDAAEVFRYEFDPSPAAEQVPLQLFEPGLSSQAEMDAQPGDTLTIEATICFGSSDIGDWAPFIDEYGQCVYADFLGKVSSDSDLTADIVDEDALLDDMPPSQDYDQYGGYLKAGWGEEPTGFFGVVKRDGYWWLISPEGNPCFYVGVCLVGAQNWPRTPTTGREDLFEWLPPRDAPWSAAWSRDAWGQGEDADYVCLYTSNLIRKYGPDNWWDLAEERALRRLDAWGFSGGGKWGAPDAIVSTPVIYAWGTPALVRHPDFFDPAVQDLFRQGLASQIEPRRDDPNILGWSCQSEYDALITRDEIREILTRPAETLSKRALLDWAVDELYGGSVSSLADAWGLAVSTREELYEANPAPPDDDVESLRLWYADRWYEFVYATIKDVDPNHLVIAPWIVPGWWESEQDWHVQARHCDVMGYDRYAMQYEDEMLSRLQSEIDKPTLCGEFSFPPLYRGERGFGRYWSSRAEDDADSGRLYHDWIQAAAEDPSCVGMIWFHYRDQPLTGRGAGYGPELVYGEHYAFGLVTETDRVKWDLVERMREANLQASRWRSEAGGRPFPDVPPDHWAGGEIAACVSAGIVAGYPDGYYRPGWTVTRGQMAVYCSRALAGGADAVPSGPGEPTFPDVPLDHWAYDSIEYAVANSIVEGYADGEFHPDWTLTRAQMAVFIARSMVTPTGEAGLADYVPPGRATFTDVLVGFWCYNHVEYLHENAVVAGYPDQSYRPTRAVARDQMAVYIARAFDLL